MLLGVLLAIIIIVSIALVAIILLQRSEGGALGMSGGGPGNFMSARGTGDLLTRTTQILAGIFFVLCLVMTLISGHNRSTSSVADRLKINGIDPSALSGAPTRTSAAGQVAPQTMPGLPGTPAPAPSRAPSAPTGLFGEAMAPAPKPAPARAKPADVPAAAPANPLANITVQSSTAPAPAAPAQ
jgi:preprotein translocase subunit SecG